MPFSGCQAVSYTDVRVLRAPLLACLTCPLCSSLVRNATTISECLHTFCRTCIHAELSNSETERCPMCSVSLGTLPLDKLQPDHQLDDLKAKLFPSGKRPKRNLGFVVAAGRALSPSGSSTSTWRRKERSLNSLGPPSEASPPLPTPDANFFSDVNFHGGKDVGNFLASSGDDDDERMLRRRPRRCSIPSLSNRVRVRRDTDCLSALDALAQAANADAAAMGEMAVPDSASISPDFPSRVNMPRMTGETSFFENGIDMEQTDGRKDGVPGSLGSRNGLLGIPNAQQTLTLTLNRNRNAHARQGMVRQMKRPSNVRVRPVAGSPPRSNVDHPGIKDNPGIKFPNGIWFHLQSADDQAEEDALPPLASPYIRIREGKKLLPVFHVKKYLVQKLARTVNCHEKDVEIACRGRPVVSSLPLESLVRDIWFRSRRPTSAVYPLLAWAEETKNHPTRGESVEEGLGRSSSSGPKDFLVVLTYRRHRKPDNVPALKPKP